MAHSIQKIESQIREAIQDTIDSGKNELLTVRFVRNKVTASLNLDEGFFLTDAWKSKSKQYIQETASELLDAKEKQLTASIEPPKPTDKQAAPLNRAPKRAAGVDKARPTKRRKKEATPPSEDETSELSEDPELEQPEDEPSDGISEEGEESSISEFNGSETSDAPESKKAKSKAKPQPKPKSKAPPKRQTKKKIAESDEDEDDEISEVVSDVKDSDAASTPPKRKVAPKVTQKSKEILNKRKSKEGVVDSDDASEHTAEDDEEPTKKASKSPEKSKKELPIQAEQSKANVSDNNDTKEEHGNDSDSSMSIILDEPPKPKKRGRKPGDSSTTSKSSKATKPAKEKEAKELSPNEALIKTLQSQLVKCGVRKIWAFELKQYGDDSKAKIKHLQVMLKGIGMVGRFSEQRAKEIKELRELQADLEAVTEGEKSWGLEGVRRRGAAVRKSLKESSGEEDEKGDDSEDKPQKAARAKQELAFLGDEESDSD